MSVFAYSLLVIGRIIDVLLTIYLWMIVARAVISWVSPFPRIPVIQILIRLTDPVLWRIRRFLPMPRMAIDITPVIAILIIMLIRYLVLEIFSAVALHL